MPFAVVLHFEVEVFAFGEDGFGVGGPVEFGGAGLCDGEALEDEAGVGVKGQVPLTAGASEADAAPRRLRRPV